MSGCFGVVVLAAVVGAVEALLCGWAFMLAVGVLHAQWWSTVPTIGFWPAVLVSALLSAALSTGSLLKGLGEGAGSR